MYPVCSFEEYMLLDSHPAFPMQFMMVFFFNGRFEQAPLREAVNAAAEDHPIFHSTLHKSDKNELYWQPQEVEISIRWNEAEVDESAAVPIVPSINYESFDIEKECPLQLVISEDATHNRSAISVICHHTAADALGLHRFVSDVLCEYGVRVGFLSAEELSSQLPKIHTDRLLRRNRYGVTFWNFLGNLHKYFWGLRGSWNFLTRKPKLLIPFELPTEQPTPSPNYPTYLSHRISPEDFQEIRANLKKDGATLNDGFLAAALSAMARFRQQEGCTKNELLRLAVPMNLRSEEDVHTPATNIVSMVFLDRKSCDITQGTWQELLLGIHRRMLHVKKNNLGLTLIFGIGLQKKLFRRLEKMVDHSHCFSTSALSNINASSFYTLFPKNAEGLPRISEAITLTNITGVAPIRVTTPAGFCVVTSPGGATVAVNYNADVLTREQVERLLLFFREALDGELE